MQKIMSAVVTNMKSFFSYISSDCLAVCIYFVCLPFTMVSTPFGSLLKVITMPVVAFLGIKLFIGKTKPLQFNVVHFVYGAYVLLCFAQLISFRANVARVTTSDIVQSYMVLLLITLRVYNEKEQQLFEDIWIIVGIVCVILCLTSKETVNEYQNRTTIYILGYEEDPNQFSAYFTMSVVVAIKRIIEKRKLAPFYGVLLMLIIYSVLKLGTRGGLIGIAVGAAACIILGARSFKSKVLIIIAAALCIAIVVVVFFPLLPEDVQARFSVKDVVDTGGSGRTDIWKFCINYTCENPKRILFGSGLCSTYVIFPSTKEVSNVVAHNQIIQTFFDQGIIGLSLYFANLATCAGKNIKKQPYYASALIAMIAFSLSLTMYVLKPYINVIMMCAMNFENIQTTDIRERKE